jgi:hypothetical protein
MAGLVPATLINMARPCPMIGIAGAGPAMTALVVAEIAISMPRKIAGVGRDAPPCSGAPAAL